MEQEDKKRLLEGIDVPALTNEEKRDLIREMHEEGFNTREIQEFVGYGESQIIKITFTLDNFKKEKEANAIVDFDKIKEEEEKEAEPDMWSVKEDHYGTKKKSSNLKYTYASLSFEEKVLYQERVKYDTK